MGDHGLDEANSGNKKGEEIIESLGIVLKELESLKMQDVGQYGGSGTVVRLLLTKLQKPRGEKNGESSLDTVG